MYRLGLKAWAAAARRPRLYHALVKIADARSRRARAAGAAPSAGCRLRAAGRGIAISPRRRAARSRRCGPTPRRGCRDERAVTPAATRSSSRSARRWGPTTPRSGAPRLPRAWARRRRRSCRSGPRDRAEELRGLFRTFLEGQSATVIEAASAAEVPAAVARYLRSTNLPLRVRVGDDAYLDALPWKSEPALERKRGRGRGRRRGGAEPRGGGGRRDGHAGAGVGGGQSGDA